VFTFDTAIAKNKRLAKIKGFTVAYWATTAAGKMAKTPNILEKFSTDNNIYTICLFQVYITDRYALRLGKWSGEFIAEHYASPARFETPKQGTSMEEFRSLLGDFLLAQFGKVDHSKIYRRIIQLADVNNDGKVWKGALFI
jgi:hypothetical protein